MNQPRSRSIAMLLAAAALVLPMHALADDDDDDKRRERKEEFWDGPCKVEREWKSNGDYKEERKCQGLGDRYAERKENFRNGPCQIEREWKKNGDFKEERKCRGRGRARGDGPGVRPVPVVVQAPPPQYPPWVVVEQGGPVYRPGREPAPPRGPVVECRSETVGRVIGGIAGAVIGNRVGKDSALPPGVATAGGAVIGVLIGGEIGRRIDERNQACIAHALEFGAAGQRVAWSEGGTQYAVVPGRAVPQRGTHCRPYDAEVLTESGWRKSRGNACRRNDGVWVAATT